jgi:hypothetical protein
VGIGQTAIISAILALGSIWLSLPLFAAVFIGGGR